MCLDNIEEIGAAVEAAKKAKAELEEFRTTPPGAFNVSSLTESEVSGILEKRVEVAEAKLRDLGFRGPVKAVAPADPAETQRIMMSR